MVLESIARGGTAGGDPDLAVNRGQVPVAGARADGECFGHLGVARSLARQAQHFDPTGGQAGKIDGRRLRSGCRWLPHRDRGGQRHSPSRGEHLFQLHHPSKTQKLYSTRIP